MGTCVNNTYQLQQSTPRNCAPAILHSCKVSVMTVCSFFNQLQGTASGGLCFKCVLLFIFNMVR
jgi:hypothetical protein